MRESRIKDQKYVNVLEFRRLKVILQEDYVYEKMISIWEDE